MSSEGSVTRWYRELENGNQTAAEELWNHFFARVVALANQKLGKSPRQARDEEDIALSAFKSLCAGIQKRRFPNLANRDDIWRLLIVITTRKAHDQIAYQHRQKRMTDAEKGTVIPSGTVGEQLQEVLSREPTPEFAVQLADSIQHLLDLLTRDDLRQVALLKLEGHTNEEIAQLLSRGVATIERKLRTIRGLWENEL